MNSPTFPSVSAALAAVVPLALAGCGAADAAPGGTPGGVVRRRAARGHRRARLDAQHQPHRHLPGPGRGLVRGGGARRRDRRAGRDVRRCSSLAAGKADVAFSVAGGAGPGPGRGRAASSRRRDHRAQHVEPGGAGRRRHRRPRRPRGQDLRRLRRPARAGADRASSWSATAATRAGGVRRRGRRRLPDRPGARPVRRRVDLRRLGRDPARRGRRASTSTPSRSSTTPTASPTGTRRSSPRPGRCWTRSRTSRAGSWRPLRAGTRRPPADPEAAAEALLAGRARARPGAGRRRAPSGWAPQYAIAATWGTQRAEVWDEVRRVPGGRGLTEPGFDSGRRVDRRVLAQLVTVLEARGLSVRFGDVVALDGVDLEVADGEFVAVVGPSGCGKSTLLRAFGGMLPPGAAVSGTLALPRCRDGGPATAWMPQRDGLLPWRRAWSNALLGAGSRGSRCPTPRRVPPSCSRRSVWRASSAPGRTSCRAGCGSGSRCCGPAWPAARCCCSTSRSARWTRSRGGG